MALSSSALFFVWDYATGVGAMLATLARRFYFRYSIENTTLICRVSPLTVETLDTFSCYARKRQPKVGERVSSTWLTGFLEFSMKAVGDRCYPRVR
jgi:hypothetical protein